MERRQLPVRWLVADERLGDELWRVVRRLPPGSGILFLYRDRPAAKRAALLSRLRQIARRRRLSVVDEAAGEAVRVHSMRELRRACLARIPLVFLSPINRTASHRDWKPLPLMRASTLARLADAPVIALGGMDPRRFNRIRALGFSGWAGIDAWLRR